MIYLVHEKAQMLGIILNSSAPEEVQTQNEDDVQQSKGARLNIFYAMFDVACNKHVEFEIKQKKIVDNLYINVSKTSNFIENKLSINVRYFF